MTRKRPSAETTRPKHIGVADAKRNFSDLLGEVRYHHERFIIERHGKPVAAIVPIDDLDPGLLDAPTGFLALVGQFDDATDFANVLDDIVRDRVKVTTRPAPRLT